MKKVIKKAALWLAISALMLFVGFQLFIGMAYYSHRWEVREVKTFYGPEFYHQDPGTTHLVKVLFGKAQFSKATRSNYVKMKLVSPGEFNRISKPKLWIGFVHEERLWTHDEQDLLKASEGEIYRLIKVLVAQQLHDERVNRFGVAVKAVKSEKELRNTVQEYLVAETKLLRDVDQMSMVELERIYLGIEKTEPDEKGYRAFWHLMQQYGNPRVIIKTDANWGDSDKAAMYAPWDNTAYLEPVHVWENLKDEIAHAKQFDSHPWWASNFWIYDAVVSGIKSVCLFWENYPKQFGKNYKDPSSVEYNAHEVVQKEFEAEFERLSRKDD